MYLLTFTQHIRWIQTIILLCKHKRTQSLHDKDLLIQQLTERVQILEQIVTEPSYELNKKLNQL
jgi:hypothetical protein